MDQSPSSNRTADMNQLREMVLDHLGIPRAGTSRHVQELQDRLPPAFMDTARHAWMAASPIPNQAVQLAEKPVYPVYQYLYDATETGSKHIDMLNSILEDLGVHSLLEDVAASPEAALLNQIPLDPYEGRLLKAASHPSPNAALSEYLNRVTKEPRCLATASAQLQQAVQASLSAHGNITVVLNVVPPGGAPSPEKPKRRKLFSGLGKMFSGLMLLAGNSIAIPTVVMGSEMALSVLGSLASGIGGVTEGIGQLRGE